MLFNSLEFLVFFPLVLFVYYCIPYKIRYLWLLASSYYFYMCWNAEYALLLLFSTMATYSCSLVIENCAKSQALNNVYLKKTIMAVGLSMNLLILFLFKYYDFASNTVSSLFSSVHVHLTVPKLDLVLPVGISFYTFQALGYMIDVYRGDIKAERNFFRYALFVSFFPQLVAGPIERSKNLLKQLRYKQRLNFSRVMSGTLIMLWGFFLKVILADHAAVFVDVVYGDIASATGVQCIAATVLFAVQVYCDFYGYSSIAVGAAKILGIDLMENFHAPYLSTSVADFWRNWHISLTSWFKDYLYIPLGGSRRGAMRKHLNKMAVFLCSGLWHGASITFVIWGGLNGLYQVIGELLSPLKNRVAQVLHINRKDPVYRLFATITTFLLIDFSWIFFRAGSLQEAAMCIDHILHDTHIAELTDGTLLACGLNRAQLLLVLLSCAILFVADYLKRRKVIIRHWIMKQRWLRWIIIAVAVYLILLLGVWGPEYDQAAFIYFQF